jgi:hypothetical protein
MPNSSSRHAPEMTPADALRLAINALRDVAESRRMPSGIALDADTAALHAQAAQTLEQSLDGLRDHE